MRRPTFNLFEDFILTVFLLHATRQLGLRPSGLGLVLEAGSVGALLGSLAGLGRLDGWVSAAPC